VGVRLANGGELMTVEQFLTRWKAQYVHSGTQVTDAPRLLEQMMVDASKAGISNSELSRAADGGLVKFILSAIRRSIEETSGSSPGSFP
jgi:hypothetical protein